MTYTSERLQELRDKYRDSGDDLSHYPIRITYLEASINGEEYSVDIEGYVSGNKLIVEDADIVKYNENTEDYEDQKYNPSLLEKYFEQQLLDKVHTLGFNVEKVVY